MSTSPVRLAKRVGLGYAAVGAADQLPPCDASLVAATTLSAPAVAKPVGYWADQIVTHNFTIDAARYIQPLPLSAGSVAQSALTAYAQDAGMSALNAAIQALVQSIQSQVATNQYFIGGVTVEFPDGLIPLTASHIMTAGRVRYRGKGNNTIFAKVGGDFGDLLHFQDAVHQNGVYCKGDTRLSDFSVIDLTATTHGALLICDTLEFGVVERLKVHNGFENIVVKGCNNVKFREVVSRSDGDLGGGQTTGSSGRFLSGSSLLSLRSVYNGDIGFVNCTIIGGDPNYRFTHDAINIQSADVVTFVGGEYGCVQRSTLHLTAVDGLPCQVIKAIGMNLDNATRCQILVDGSTSTPFGSNSIFDVACYNPDENFVNIANTAFSGASFRLNATGAPREAIVCKGSSCSFSGKLRGVGTGATANGQYSAIWLGGAPMNTVRNMDLESSATYALAYGVEITLGAGYGNAVQSSTLLPGAALGGTSYNDGSFDTTGLVVAGGAPKSVASSSAARTTPTTISTT